MTTKERILEATLELASEKGLGSISLSQIAEKVGIQKASLYSHYTAKEEIISSLYEYLREKTVTAHTQTPIDYGELVKGKSAKEVLHFVISSYSEITNDSGMSVIYKFVVSERVFRKEAAQIMVWETEKMILATKNLFYAMQVHNLMDFTNIDMAATSFALTINSLLNYCLDKKLAESVDISGMVEDYVEDFCRLYDARNEK
ncbi:MAG: TetR/AcrR family transcriptional regulator [Lachnospiraceae bacterium]|nr:TetR/AcrR family transcriptional regulator [Lachnospiraceae bacterium]